VVLVSSRIVRDTLNNILVDFGLVRNPGASAQMLHVLTHYKFKYYDLDYESVIFMEPGQDSVRKVEIYGVVHAVKTYFLVYSGSLEEQRYLSEIRNEKAAFEKLIEERARLPLRLDDKEEAIDLEEHEDSDRTYKIVVDVRELRSDLPFYLFRARNDIHISTLPVGDYLLSPRTCIERNTIPDFISSLNSGRLYLQAKMLCYKYSNPLLLLEFDGRPSLSDHYNHNQDTFKNSIVAKFTLFLSSFSQLRVIWSDSRLFSTKVIRDLHRNESESPAEEDESMDPTLQEILLTIPGITQFNFKKVVKHFTNLKDLISAGKDRLEKVLGLESSALVYSFFRKRI